MAVVIEEPNFESIVADTGDDYTVVDAVDSVICCGFATDNSGTLGTRTFTIDSSAWDHEDTHAVVGTTSPWVKTAVGVMDESSLTTGAKTIILTNSENLANEGMYFLECSGVDQADPIRSRELLNPESGGTVMPTHSSVSITEGDLVVLISTCSNGPTITAPSSALGGTDAWTTQCADIVGLVGGGANGGTVCTAIATGDYTTDITMLIDGDANITVSMCVVIRAAADGDTTLTADPGALTLTGATAGFTVTLAATLGALAFTGAEATLAETTALTADPSELTLLGADANTDITMVGDAGTLTFTGGEAVFTQTTTLTADPGSLVLSGSDADFIETIVLAADPGALLLTGADATLDAGEDITLVADPAILTLSGAIAAFVQTQVADPSELTLVGGEADFTEILVLDAQPGALLFIGGEATLVISDNITLIADPAALLFTGAEAILVAGDIILTADPGTLVFTGADATLRSDVILIANPASLLFTGSNATLVAGVGGLPPVATPTTNFSGKVNLDLADPGDIEHPATDRAIRFIHDALEQLSQDSITNHDELNNVTPDQHHPQEHDFFGDDHSNKPTAIITLVSLTTEIGNIIICNNTDPIVITLHPIQVSDPVTIVRANIGTVTIDGDGALIMGQPTMLLPLPGDAADLIGTDIGWRLT